MFRAAQLQLWTSWNLCLLEGIQLHFRSQCSLSPFLGHLSLVCVYLIAGKNDNIHLVCVGVGLL